MIARDRLLGQGSATGSTALKDIFTLQAHQKQRYQNHHRDHDGADDVPSVTKVLHGSK